MHPTFVLSLYISLRLYRVRVYYVSDTCIVSVHISTSLIGFEFDINDIEFEFIYLTFLLCLDISLHLYIDVCVGYSHSRVYDYSQLRVLVRGLCLPQARFTPLHSVHHMCS